MKRLIFCPGICQIVNAAAALDRDHGCDRAKQEDILVLFGRGRDSEYGRTLAQMAKIVWPWRDIVWAEDVVLSYFPTRRYAPVAREMLIRRLGRDVDEIWVSMLWMDSTKLMLYAFPDARVVLFEDGAVEYLAQEIACGRSRWKHLRPNRWPGALRREWSHWNARPECMEINEICMRDLRRVDMMYSFLDRYLGLPDYLAGVRVARVDEHNLRARYEALLKYEQQETGIPSPEYRDKPAVLFLPQPFAVLFLTTEDEYALYRSAVTLILDRGYAVLWKEHPQETTPLAPRLKEELGGDDLHALSARRHLPVECLASEWNLAGVISVSSTALLNLHALYDYPMYTAADQLDLSRWLMKTEKELARLFLKCVPGLKQLPTM